jgi:hypothetical protein
MINLMDAGVAALCVFLEFSNYRLNKEGQKKCRRMD